MKRLARSLTAPQVVAVPRSDRCRRPAANCLIRCACDATPAIFAVSREIGVPLQKDGAKIQTIKGQ